MKKTVIHSCLLLLALLIWCCGGPQRQYRAKPAKSLTNPESDLLEVNSVAYHVNDSVTTVYLEVKNENLIYKRPDTTVAFYAEIKVAYHLFSEQNNKRIIDSSSFYMNDRAGDKVENKSLQAKFNVRAKAGSNYFLDIDVYDLNKKTKYTQHLAIHKQSPYSSQNFFITSNKHLSFKNNFLKGDQVTIRYNNPSFTSFTVQCFFREFGPAPPPFSSHTPDATKYTPDSAFIIEPSNNQFSLVMPNRGFYFVQLSPTGSEGITLFTVDETFPGVSDSDEMISCTRYIMNKSEYDNCKSADDKKAAIDNFWLSIGGSNERARELLKRYYGRVKEANKNYTSYAKGWKTDRGMIYIVFGTPTNTYRSRKDEVWVYGNEANPNTLRFVFNKMNNPLADNDFVMERSQFYKDPWYRAVDYWRQGNVYLDNSKR